MINARRVVLLYSLVIVQQWRLLVQPASGIVPTLKASLRCLLSADLKLRQRRLAVKRPASF